MIDFVAREIHFLAHLAPVFHALPDELRGTFYVHPRLVGAAAGHGIDAVAIPLPDSEQITVAAAYRDLKLARKAGRPVVLSEHGAGQSYLGVTSGSYIGAADREGVIAVLVPGDDAAARHRAVHPEIPAYAVGVPKLDELHAAPARERRTPPVVAITFHWNCKLCPEARGAFIHYRSALPTLARQMRLIGHGHPRILPRLAPHYRRMGIEVVEDFAEVIERADVLCADNTSVMYEWASLDRPVVVMNDPRYRRGVEHGLRFWEHSELGPHVWRPSQLHRAIRRALMDTPAIADRRREIVKAVYAACDGRASERAVQALTTIESETRCSSTSTSSASAKSPPISTT